jgi:NAD(P)-dependent dehydrogenase (short-subunit alcohol dehydrogenase family)
LRPSPASVAYSAAKAGVIGYTEAMNEELDDDGIKSVALCPGYVDTDMAAGAKDVEVPAAHMLKPQDLAEAVRFLLKVSPACLVPEVIQRRRYRGAGATA